MFTDSLSQSDFRRHTAGRRILPVDCIGGSLVLAVVLVTLWIVTGPLAAARSDLVTEIEAHQTMLAQSDSIEACYCDMTDRVQTQHQHLQQLMGMVPERPSESEFLAQLSELASQSGVQLLHFEPQATTQHDPHSEISIRCSAQANYPAVCKFLYGMSDLPRLTDVTRFTIRQSTDEHSILMVELEISIFHL